MRGQLRIEQMFAFIVVDDDHTEGIPAFNANGMAMPLVGADMDRIASLRPIALKMAQELNKPVTLVKFSQREELELFLPPVQTEIPS